jgi:hypothetical protein
MALFGTGAHACAASSVDPSAWLMLFRGLPTTMDDTLQRVTPGFGTIV